MFVLPVYVPGKRLLLRVTERDLEGDNLLEVRARDCGVILEMSCRLNEACRHVMAQVVREFCRTNELPLEGNVARLSRSVYKGLMPSAFVL